MSSQICQAFAWIYGDFERVKFRQGWKILRRFYSTKSQKTLKSHKIFHFTLDKDTIFYYNHAFTLRSGLAQR